MNGRFAVRHKFVGSGWRLDDKRHMTPDDADSHSLGSEFAGADTEVVELTRGLVILVSSRFVCERGAAS